MKLYILILVLIICQSYQRKIIVENTDEIYLNASNSSFFDEPVMFALENVTEPVAFNYFTRPSRCMNSVVMEDGLFTDKAGYRLDYIYLSKPLPIQDCRLFIHTPDTNETFFLVYLRYSYNFTNNGHSYEDLDKIEPAASTAETSAVEAVVAAVPVVVETFITHIKQLQVMWSVLDKQLEILIQSCMYGCDIPATTISISTSHGLSADWIDVTDYSQVGKCETVAGMETSCCQHWVIRTTSLDAPCITSTLQIVFHMIGMNDTSSTFIVDECIPQNLNKDGIGEDFKLEFKAVKDNTTSNKPSHGKYHIVYASLVPIDGDIYEKENACTLYKPVIDRITSCSVNNTGLITLCSQVPINERHIIYDAKEKLAQDLLSKWDLSIYTYNECSNSLAIKYISRKFNEKKVLLTFDYHFYKVSEHKLAGGAEVSYNTSSNSIMMDVTCPDNHPYYDQDLDTCFQIHNISAPGSILAIVFVICGITAVNVFIWCCLDRKKPSSKIL